MNWLQRSDVGLGGEQLHQIFDGCAGVVVDIDRMVFHVWNGSMTVNVYSFCGDPLDCWMKDDMDLQDFRSTALAHYADSEEEVN